MNNTDNKPTETHHAERTLYKVQVRRKRSASPSILLNGQLIGIEWVDAPLAEATYRFTEHTDTAAEIFNELFPYALAMNHAWSILSVAHAYAFEVRLVPHRVETSYSQLPLEPLPELDRNPT